ncbi:protein DETOXIFICATION 16-like isoform X2 [Aristolochia californica]|uniref:protein DETOXIFICATION 16-like isoform X2 n=1 Tax=Aristolochia californica TaxID=171875 RepID=UPI0035D8344C
MEEKEQCSSMQFPLIAVHQGELERTATTCIRREIFQEAKTQLFLAGPLVAVSLLQYCLQVISVAFVGHLGELALSSASLATSFAGVTGYSVLLGLGSALDTLCGQAYGAKQYHMLGIHMQRALFVILLVSVPLAVIWMYMGLILMVLGQDPEISSGAELYARWMIPSLFAYGFLQCLVKFLQAQGIVYPMIVCSGITTLLHILMCWLLVLKFGLGQKGAALANSISYWLNVLLLAFYVKFSNTCKESWNGLSKEAFTQSCVFLSLAIPSAVMVCLEYWSFELVVLLSGLLPNPKLEMSILSISINTMWLVYMIPFGLSSAISTRVSNELGASRPQAARLAVSVAAIMTLSEGTVVGLTSILVRRSWGHLYSNEEQVVEHISTMMPLLVTSNFLDGIQCVLSGAARGCGRQKMCAFINLVAYYGVAIPVAVLFAFVFRIGGEGLWMGIISGLVAQARHAGERVHFSTIPIN